MSIVINPLHPNYILLKNAITAINERGEYPSASRINQELGRNTKSLNGYACKARRKIFEELGITLLKTSWNKRPRSDWYNE